MRRVEAIAFARMMPDSEIAATLKLQRLRPGRYLVHNRKPKPGKYRRKRS
ncbi:hypothetical protein [Bradyrhizobium elkanii]|nr:hypothetical protein [Bradyrhizobium elkanii]